MYKKPSKQLTIYSFEMPWGMELLPDNEWVIKAKIIPWEEFESHYIFEHFKDKTTGNVAKHFRLVFGALYIQQELNLSDRKLVRLIKESPYLQYFCGLPKFTQESPFTPSSLVNFRRRISVEMFNKFNELIIAKGLEYKRQALAVCSEQKKKELRLKDLNDDLILDSSCAPQYISYPNDLSLLNKTREKLEMMLKMLYNPIDGEEPYADSKLARKSFLSLIMKPKKSFEDIHQAKGVQLSYIERYIDKLNEYLSIGRNLQARYITVFNVCCLVYEQQKHIFDHRTNKIKDRVLSLHAWWVRSVYRNKSGKKYEYGTQFDLSIYNGFARLEKTSFDPYNEGSTLPLAVERFFAIYGRYPENVIADTKYRSDGNKELCKEHDIKLIGKPLGHKGKYLDYTEEEIRVNENKRSEVEQKIGRAKENHGLGLIKTRLPETTKTMIYLSILAMNIAIAMKYNIIFSLFNILLVAFIVSGIYSMVKSGWKYDFLRLGAENVPC